MARKGQRGRSDSGKSSKSGKSGPSGGSGKPKRSGNSGEGSKTSLTKRILKLFKDNPQEEFGQKEIVKKFIRTDDKNKIDKALHRLLSRDRIEKTADYRFKLKKREASERTGTIVEGVLDMTMSGSGFVISPDTTEDIFISQDDLNRAFDGDRVKVALLREGRKKRPEGEIIEIISRARTEIVGTLEMSENFGFVIPDKKKMGAHLFIPKDKLEGVKNGDRVIATITDWPEGKKNPYGKIIERLGSVGINDVEMKTILVENGFPLHFPNAVLEEVEQLEFDISQSEIDRRKDFRGVTTFTIDPVDAKDFDDALSIRKLSNGNWEVGVHIADVSHYVKPKTALNKEAYRRATSVYLVDRVLPMLPEQLSNMVCSLRPDEEKLTFAAIFEMDKNANVLKRWFGRTIIKSDRRFTYEEVQEIIETGKGDFNKEIKTLNELAYKLRETKFKNGAIAFETVEVKFHIDLEGVPLGVYVKERKDAHMLVEDFMLLANKEVAEFITKTEIKGKQPVGVYRVHDSPDQEKLEDFARFAMKFGYKMQMDTPDQVRKSLNDLMEQIKGKPEQDLLEQLAIRSMAKAVYTTKNIGHYGLAFEFYTHFTSPIRRYPDVLVHRILQDVLDKKPPGDRKELEEQCTHSSWMERKAMDAERESVKYKQVEFMSKRVGEEYDGLITGVTSFGIFVAIIENHCEGLVSIDSMRDDFYTFDPKENALIGLDTQRKFRLGDKVRIKVIKTSLEKRQIDFELVDEEE